MLRSLSMWSVVQGPCGRITSARALKKQTRFQNTPVAKSLYLQYSPGVLFLFGKVHHNVYWRNHSYSQQNQGLKFIAKTSLKLSFSAVFALWEHDSSLLRLAEFIHCLCSMTVPLQSNWAGLSESTLKHAAAQSTTQCSGLKHFLWKMLPKMKGFDFLVAIQ